jgi:hypothetical protein
MADDRQKRYDCEAAREFTTTAEYLRNPDDLALQEPIITQKALAVAEGCTGAAESFITTVDLLRQSGLPARQAIDLGIRVARAPQPVAKGFIEVFRACYDKNVLDLDLTTSLRFAEGLSLQLVGPADLATDDFIEVTTFCLSRSGPGLSKPQCADLAGRIAQISSKTETSMSNTFSDTYEYLVDRNGPALSAGDATALAERITKAGPMALENFREAFRYATSEQGAKLERQAAIVLATSVADRSQADATPKSSETPR